MLRCVKIEFEMVREDTHHGRGFDVAAVVRVLTHRKAVNITQSKAVKHHATQGGYFIKMKSIFGGVGFVTVRENWV